jgi:transposase-like protein
MAESTFRQLGKIQTEAEAYAYMEQLRWPDGPVCPHCGNTDKHYFLKPRTQLDGKEARKTRTGSHSERRVWKCAVCRKQFSVMTGTIFHGSKVPLQTWLMVIFEMCASKNGMAAREIERKYGVAPKTAWFMAHRIREAMRNRGSHKLIGDIIADETYIGGNPKNWHANDPRKQTVKRGRGTHKTPVVAIIDADTGEARSAVVPNVTAKTLRRVIAENVTLAESTLHTDALSSYNRVGSRMAGHFAVNHEAGEYVSEKSLGTQMAESYFAQLKRSLDGTHHHVAREHLDRYLDEFDFRFSTCKINDTERMNRLMGQTGRRLSYKRIAKG